MLIRRELPTDVDVIRTVTAAAFGRDAEAKLVDQLRADPGWLPGLSLVAIEPDEGVVGHVLVTRAHLDAAPVLGLGPLSVRPDRQRTGVGSALMHAVLGAADAGNESLVVLLGDPDYYHRFGFVLAQWYGIAPPVEAWRPHFQVRTLTAYHPRLRGTFRYAKPFDSV